MTDLRKSGFLEYRQHRRGNRHAAGAGRIVGSLHHIARRNNRDAWEACKVPFLKGE